MKKGLLIRLDKIGDLISTVPCDELLPPQIEGHWMISKGLGEILQAATPTRQWTEFQKKYSLSQLILFIRFLRQNRFNFAISFQAPWWVSFALWFAGVPQRFGTRSQWHHFLFLTHGLRQKRSQATQHEADYNADLIDHALTKLGFPQESKPTPYLKLNAPGVWKKPDQLKKYFVVHPGMAGSARNWSQAQYIEAIELLLKKDETLQAVLTGTPADEPYLVQIKSHFANHPRVHIYQNKLNMKELLDCLKQAEFVLAPSTGVLHLSASLGQRTLGIYSPILVQHPTRWAARGPKTSVFVPEARCPAQHKCLGQGCHYFDCMNSVKPSQVVHTI